MDIIQKSGAWYSFNGDRLGQGRENSKQFLKDNPQTAEVIEKKIRENSNLTATAGDLHDDEDEDDLEAIE
jgi:recombination protein RecA